MNMAFSCLYKRVDLVMRDAHKLVISIFNMSFCNVFRSPVMSVKYGGQCDPNGPVYAERTAGICESKAGKLEPASPADRSV